MKKISLLLATLGLCLAGSVQAATTKEVSQHPVGERSVYSERATIERIKPIGSVCVEGTECAAAAAAPVAAAASGGTRSGEDIYNSTCAGCHGTGAAGAPKLGDKGDWGKRLGQGKETLYKHAIAGFNAMPAKGMCMNCSDDEVKATVDFMLSKSK